MDLAEVKAFNCELSALYDNRPPISKAKMGAITRGAIKAIKFYKHVVHSVEKFILKCKAEYKIPGLYVIDSIVRQSRHQFGADKDVFAPRFAKNMQQTFGNLLRCPSEDKRNIIRVLNLWQKNNVFGSEVIQPLFDMIANHPIHQENATQIPHSNGSGNNESKNSPNNNTQHTPNLTQNSEQIRQNMRNHESAPATAAQPSSSVNFNRTLLNDFDYESEDDGVAGDSSPVLSRNPVTSAPPQPQQLPYQNSQLNNNFSINSSQPLHNPDAFGSILTNPEFIRHLQSLQSNMFANLPLQPVPISQDVNFVDTSQPPPILHTKMDDNTATGTSPLLDEVNNESDIEFVDDAGPQVIEIDGNDSRSPSPKSSRRRRSRSRERSRRSRSRSRRNSRSRSRDRRRRNSRDRSRDRTARDKPRDREKEKEREKEREKEKEKERERRKKGLPPIKKDTLSVCSTTLWVGHLSKLVQEEELSDDFGAIGDVVSIDLVSPRGCAFIVMNRRRDAARAIAKLNKHKMHSKAITVAWAPSKGVKSREWKDFWEVEAGACYIPWSRLPSGPNDGNGLAVLEILEEGGVFDDETLPNWLQRKGAGIEIKPMTMTDLMTASGLQTNQSGMMVVSPLQPPLSLGVDTSCLPPPLGTLSFPPHPALPMTIPFLGLKASPQPGLQALHLQAVLAHQQQQLATQILLTPPPRLQTHPSIAAMRTLQAAQSLMESNQDDAMELDTGDDAISHSDNLLQSMDMLKQNSHDDSHLSEKLKALVANPPPSFSIPPPNIPNLLGKHPLLSSQPFSVSQPPPSLNMHPSDQNAPMPLLQNNIQLPGDRDKDGKRDRDNNRKDRGDRRDRDRDRTRERHDRDRDRDRDRERGDRGERDRGDKERGGSGNCGGGGGGGDKDRERGDKERDRDRSGRDRGNRWGGRVQEPRPNREQSPNGLNRHGGLGNNVANERSLQDRLWEMANGPGPRPQQHPDSPPRLMRNNDRSKDAHMNDSLLGDGPTDIERRKNRPRDSSPGSIMGPNGPLGLGPLGPGCPLGPVGPNGPMGPLNNMGIMGPNIPMMNRSALPPMAPFRIGRDEIRMRNMGPRGPPVMRPGVWMDGPAPYGPRFNGGPGYNRPPFERSYDDSPYDRNFDRPHFDGPGRAPFDAPPYDSSRFDGPDGYYDRGGQRGPRGPRSVEGRRSRGDRDKDGRGDRPPRSSRWAENDSSEKHMNPNETIVENKNLEPDDNSKEMPIPEMSIEKPADFEKSPKSQVAPEPTLEIVNNEKPKDENIDFVMAPSIAENNDDRVIEKTYSIEDQVMEPSKESLDNVTDDSCNDRLEDAADEGRGTPCRDEPIGASNSTPDLTDP